MAMELLTERHGDQIAGVLGCWDRMLIFGTLPRICFAGGMTSFLFERKIRIFDHPKFAEPFRNRIRENAESTTSRRPLDSLEICFYLLERVNHRPFSSVLVGGRRRLSMKAI